MKQASNLALVALAAANLVIILVMQVVGEDLHPYNIVQFEFAGTLQRAELMVQSWRDHDVMSSVFFLIGFDYLFMVSYSTFLWLSCRTIGTRFDGRAGAVIWYIAYSQFLAATLDAVENLALYKMAGGSIVAAWPKVAAYCAAPKFAIALVGVAVMLFGLGRWIFERVR